MRHYIGTIEDSDVKTYCIMNDEGIVVSCNSIAHGDEKFFDEVVKATQFYNAIKIEESNPKAQEKFDMHRKHKLTYISNLETTSLRYFKTEKGKKALAVLLFENDCVDYSLIEELKQYGVKIAEKEDNEKK